MTVASITELFELLGRDPRQVVGEVETPWLDFKKEPYAIARKTNGHEFHRQQLAKDVAVLAADGGVILIGVETGLETNEQVERATGLNPVSPGLVDPKQIQDVIWEWVYPKLNVEVRPHAVPEQTGQLWTIYVKTQRERDMPFIVKKMAAGQSGADDNFFGVFERAGTHNTAISPAQVHSWIQKGYRAEVRDVPFEPTADQFTEADDILKEDFAALGLSGSERYLSIQAAPLRPTKLSRFFVGGTDSLQELLRDLPQLRPSGFNLPDGVDPERTARGALRNSWHKSDSLSVTPTGIATAVQGEEHLTWASESIAIRGERWINPTALVEYTMEFWRFYLGQVKKRMEVESPVYWRVRMGNLLGSSPVFLPERADHSPERHEAHVPDFVTAWVEFKAGSAGKAAFDTLSAVYERFGWSEAAIPLTKGGEVSEEAIVNIKSRG
jgi:hypothetical protein